MFRLVHAAILAAMLGSLGPARSEPSPGSKTKTPARADAAIKDIIPHKKPGQEICFAGDFADQAIDMQDVSKTVSEIVPGVEAGGKPAIRAVPAALPKQDVSRIALHLTYHNRIREGSFDVMFTVMARSNSLNKELLARSGCIWSGWSAEQEKETLPQTKLGCWIECDGGGMTAERIAGTRSLNVRFDALSMQAGCEGGGAYRIGTSDMSKKTNFRLERVPLRVCKGLKAWGKKQWPA